MGSQVLLRVRNLLGLGRATNSVADPCTSGVAAPERPGLRALSMAADRTLAPFYPALQAMRATWPPDMPPEVVLRAALLLALFGVADERDLSRNATADAAIRRFLRLPVGNAPLDPSELARGLVRLADNTQARAAVRSIVAALRDEAASEREGLVENDSVIALWTAGAAATAAEASVT